MPSTTHPRSRSPRRILAGALGALALLPAAASAATITYEGDVLVVRAAPGERNDLTVSGENPGQVSISDSGGPASFPAGRCEQLGPEYAVHCETPRALRAELGDLDDRAVVNHTAPAGLVVDVLGGDGRDDLKTIDGRTVATLDGQGGNDALRSEEGGDTLLGGAGDDDLLGNAGADVLRGGEGADDLRGDGTGPAAGDVLDGGPGFDTVEDWFTTGDGGDRRPIGVTFNGVADDGRPGEGDDVSAIENVQVYVAGTFVMGEGDERVGVFAPADLGPSRIEGRGGNDDLRAGSSSETIDGGAGDDRVEGGFGPDTITGGPGRDQLFGDSTAGNCGGFGQSCTVPFGNDTILARDGEADSIDCGVGQDRAVVDAVDVVANCEVVEGGSVPGAPGGGSGTSGGPVPGAGTRAALTVVAAPRLGTALRRGLRLRLAGLPAARTVVVQARHGRRLVGRVAVRTSATGAATTTVRFTRAARRSLARKRSVRLVLTAGSARRTITLKR